MTRHLIHSLSVVVLLGAVSAASAADQAKIVSFTALEDTKAEKVKGQAAEWLKKTGKVDAATTQQFEAIWKQDRPVLHRLAATFALGSKQARTLLAEAENKALPAPTKVPAILSDKNQSEFFRANLTLAYARALCSRYVYEQSLDALKLYRPEDVVSPSAYLFHRAVCEHAMVEREDARRTVSRLIDDAVDAPDRYLKLSMLMLLDMETWRSKDLGAIARKMGNIRRRLDLARGGPKTQKMQKEVVLRLDEIIKKLENKAKGGGGGGGGGNPNGGGCPNGGPGSQPGNGAGQPNAPMQDSNPGGQSGKGDVDIVKLRKTIDAWGSMSKKEQAEAVRRLTEGMSPRYREAVERYLQLISKRRRVN